MFCWGESTSIQAVSLESPDRRCELGLDAISSESWECPELGQLGIKDEENVYVLIKRRQVTDTRKTTHSDVSTTCLHRGFFVVVFVVVLGGKTK